MDIRQYEPRENIISTEAEAKLYSEIPAKYYNEVIKVMKSLSGEE